MCVFMDSCNVGNEFWVKEMCVTTRRLTDFIDSVKAAMASRVLVIIIGKSVVV